MNLTKKEQKLLWLDRYNRKHCNCRLKVGDYCRILHTTAHTLLGKTQVSLREKVYQSIISAIRKKRGSEK
ncbi:hypothetical protein [Clostridium felsineum]|uniref:hypothetical protein n=1 Tax=Clostridium felsineum TaxID=36839 RepID=UPI00098CC472|nr:hypothetical protein [Clostridium felsineum]URZ15316.1 hypothetical protein CLFE_013340 [Clostridium felsineum DSM 794]